MFNINWLKLINENVPLLWLKNIRLVWLNVLLSQIKVRYNEFIQYRTDALYKLSFNGQTIYLEHVLNDKFDNIGRGIYIDNVVDLDFAYLFNTIEARDPVYWYNNWNIATAYVAGEFSVDGNKVYTALANTTGDRPSTSPSKWAFYKSNPFLKNATEYIIVYDFIVMVPVAVIFDINEMKALVNYYRAAGKRFTIQTY